MFCGIAGPDEVAGVAIHLNCCGVKSRSVLSIDWRACSTDPARRSRRGGSADQPPAATLHERVGRDVKTRPDFNMCERKEQPRRALGSRG